MAITRDEILNMPAGEKMDKLIAEGVLHLSVEHLPTVYEEGSTEDGKDGWSGFVCPRCRRPSDMLDEPCTKYYSANIAAAWGVVEKLCNETGCDIVKVCKRDPELLRGEWSCNFGQGAEAFADTAPLAICRAALLAVLGND